MDDKKKPPAPPVEEMVLKPAGPVAVSTTVKPLPGAADHEIHVRHTLPVVPDRAPTESDTEDSKKVESASSLSEPCSLVKGSHFGSCLKWLDGGVSLDLAILRLRED